MVVRPKGCVGMGGGNSCRLSRNAHFMNVGVLCTGFIYDDIVKRHFKDSSVSGKFEGQLKYQPLTFIVKKAQKNTCTKNRPQNHDIDNRKLEERHRGS